MGCGALIPIASFYVGILPGHGPVGVSAAVVIGIVAATVVNPHVAIVVPIRIVDLDIVKIIKDFIVSDAIGPDLFQIVGPMVIGLAWAIPIRLWVRRFKSSFELLPCPIKSKAHLW